MAINYPQLKTEITTDPQALGYAGKSDSECADILNLIRATIIIRRDNIMPFEVLEAVDNRDFDTLITAAQIGLLQALAGQRALRIINDDGTDTRTLGNLRRMFQNPGPQGTRARLVDMANRDGSRAEQLFGTNTFITPSDVAQARES